jgi:hypothetical protein
MINRPAARRSFSPCTISSRASTRTGAPGAGTFGAKRATLPPNRDRHACAAAWVAKWASSASRFRPGFSTIIQLHSPVAASRAVQPASASGTIERLQRQFAPALARLLIRRQVGPQDGPGRDEAAGLDQELRGRVLGNLEAVQGPVLTAIGPVGADE